MNIQTSRPMKVVAAVLETVSTDGHKIDTIDDFCNLSAEELTDVGSKIGDLSDEAVEVLNTKILALVENLKDGELWQLLIVSRKIEDARFLLPALDFEQEVEKRSMDFDRAVRQILEYFVEENITADFEEKKMDPLIAKLADLQIVMIEKEIAAGDDLQLGNVLNLFFNMYMVNDIIDTQSGRGLALKVQEDFDFNYKDSIVDQIIFILKNMYDLHEDDLRDAEDGISVAKIVGFLESYM